MNVAPSYSNRIELGHIIQVIAMIVTIGGGLIGVYITINDRLTAQAERIGAMNTQVIELVKKTEQMTADRRLVEKDVGVSLQKLVEQLTDLRILVASIRDGKK